MAVENISSLHLQRRLESSPERVFDAWVNPETVRKWLFTTPTSESNTTQIDARADGQWVITDRRDGVDYKALGVYVEIDRPRRLVFTFGMPQFSPEFALVIVEIAPEGNGSLVTITHERLPWSHVKETEQGWKNMFTQLASVLGE